MKTLQLTFWIILFLSGCAQLQSPPHFFLQHVDQEPEYVSKTPKWFMLGWTDWNGEIYIKKTHPLFVSRKEVLLHEQAHSFEILAAKNRPTEYKKFRMKFDKTYKSKYIEVEAFPKAVIRALKGKKDKGALLALKFISGK